MTERIGKLYDPVVDLADPTGFCSLASDTNPLLDGCLTYGRHLLSHFRLQITARIGESLSGGTNDVLCASHALSHQGLSGKAC